MRITFDLAHHGDYWWEKRGTISIDVDSIESFEQCYDRTPGGSTSASYVLITMKSGVQHKIYGDYDDVSRKLP